MYIYIYDIGMFASPTESGARPRRAYIIVILLAIGTNNIIYCYMTNNTNL